MLGVCNQRLQLQCGEPLSNVAFSSTLRRYNSGKTDELDSVFAVLRGKKTMCAVTGVCGAAFDAASYHGRASQNMLVVLPKFPMLNSPNSALYARVMHKYTHLCRPIFERRAGKMPEHAKEMPHVPITRPKRSTSAH